VTGSHLCSATERSNLPSELNTESNLGEIGSLRLKEGRIGERPLQGVVSVESSGESSSEPELSADLERGRVVEYMYMFLRTVRFQFG
jgi:hypothetical protein